MLSETTRNREQSRFNLGLYKAPPFATAGILKPEHFAHLSLKSPGEIAYTKNADEGDRDIQRRVKAGKYLQKYFSERLSAPQIAEWAAKCRTEAEATAANPIGAHNAISTPPSTLIGVWGQHLPVTILESPEDCVRAYLEGPDGSCMNFKPPKSPGEFIYKHEGSEHPAGILGFPGDLRTAIYLRDGRVTARVNVWPSQKLFYDRPYGDANAISSVLRAAGYRADLNRCFIGARVRAVPNLNPNRDLYPFCAISLDGSNHYYVEDGAFLKLVSRDDFLAAPIATRGILHYSKGVAVRSTPSNPEPSKF